jgi:hypothetical protein
MSEGGGKDGSAGGAAQERISKNLDRRVNQFLADLTTYDATAPAPLVIVATGDSWFNYPLTGNFPLGTTDTIAELREQLAEGSVMLNLAVAGDPTTEILGVTKRARLSSALTRSTVPVDAILFSGGGDDFAGDLFRFWLNDAGGDPKPALSALFDNIEAIVEAGYRDLIALRDARAPGARIFMHGYDYAWPTGKGLDWAGMGPWLYPSLHDRGWMTDRSPGQLARGRDIVRVMLDRFATVLAGLVSDTVVLVPTLGLLGDDRTLWANELHPTADGFRQVAGRFAASLAAAFPNRTVRSAGT